MGMNFISTAKYLIYSEEKNDKIKFKIHKWNVCNLFTIFFVIA